MGEYLTEEGYFHAGAVITVSVLEEHLRQLSAKNGISVESPDANGLPDTLRYAQEALSGKRTALVGFAEASARELARILTEADAFSRTLPLDVHPSAEVLKPFELILLNAEAAAGAAWLAPEELGSVSERLMALGRASVLLRLVADPRLPLQRFCVWPAPAEESGGGRRSEGPGPRGLRRCYRARTGFSCLQVPWRGPRSS